MNNDLLSLVRRFGNDFHSWLRHSWKSLPNRLTRDKKSLFTVTRALFFISLSAVVLICNFEWKVKYRYIQTIHYSDVIMSAKASQITSLMTVYSTVYSGADHRKYQSSQSLAFLWGPVNSPHKVTHKVTRKYFHLMTSPWDSTICTF